MARPKKQVLGYWMTEEDERVWVHQAGRSYSLSHGGRDHLCHRSVRDLEDTKKEAAIALHVSPVDFHWSG